MQELEFHAKQVHRSSSSRGLESFDTTKKKTKMLLYGFAYIGLIYELSDKMS